MPAVLGSEAEPLAGGFQAGAEQRLGLGAAAGLDQEVGQVERQVEGQGPVRSLELAVALERVAEQRLGFGRL